jgi:hypothetical protein
MLVRGNANHSPPQLKSNAALQGSRLRGHRRRRRRVSEGGEHALAADSNRPAIIGLCRGRGGFRRLIVRLVRSPRRVDPSIAIRNAIRL